MTAVAPRTGARSIAEALGLPSPTDEQVAVIEAPSAPSIVVAGAGSGKTETMANRAVWLVANGEAAPSEILGLTFTRKAAGELAERVQRRLLDGVAAGVVDMPGDDVFDRPTVATYNSFADGLFRENALLVGRDPESALLDDAAAWRLARRVVVAHGDDRLIGIGKSVDKVTEAVVDLSHALADNIANGDDVRRLVEQFTAITELPYGGSKRSPYAKVLDAVGTVAALGPLTDLAERFAEEKRRRGLVEFSDQVALALAACERDPSIVAATRRRFRAVILDEYQDTSVVQTRLLSLLFADHSVMAVGDPHQSIYGWRGASADNLSRFSGDFARATTAESFTLSTSWRNDTIILDAANALVEPLRAGQAVPVPELAARPGVGSGTLEIAFAETIEQEAARVAEWMERIVRAERGDADPPTAAILFRVRRHMDLFARALAERGVPHRILGLGGLLSSPEITDLVAALRVCHDPSAGSSLIRVLSGPRWRIGVRDLRELRTLASWLERRDVRSSRLSDETIERIRASIAADGTVSIIDALDALRDMPDTHVALGGFSAAGLERLRDAAHLFRLFRSRAGAPVLDFITLVTAGMRLDLEVVANAARSTLRTANSRLHAFMDEVSSFLASEETPTLGSVLAWLDRAETQDMMGPRVEPPEPGEVQLLTMHGSKGLEWDAVAVVRLVDHEFPADGKDGKGWVSFGTLPYDFRGDAAELPVFAWRGAETQQDVNAALGRFSEELAARHALEERRLAYVALTRARSRLLLSGSFWAEQKAPRSPSVFLADLAVAGIVEPLPESPESAENPLADDDDVLMWPGDPLGSRRRTIERAAHLVRSVAEDDPTLAIETGAYAETIDLLLAERATLAAPAGREIPARVAASRFKDYLSDPDAVVSSIERPVPERPYRQTLLGTLFHAWVERRFTATGSPETIDAAADEIDLGWDDGTFADLGGPGDDATDLADLQTTFEASEWADLRPIEVEREIHAIIAGRIVVCKLDAVYERDGIRQIVDWKTGKPPRNDAELEERQIQLALYRLAYASWAGISPELVDAVFYYVSEDRVIRPERFFSEDELRSRWDAAMDAVTGSAAS